MLTMQTIQDVVARIDLVELIREDIGLKKAGKDYEAHCPFHDEKTPSFTVSPDKQFYHCFGCGANGDALSWMREYHHLPFIQAMQALAGRVGVDLGNLDPGEVRARKAKQTTREIEAALVIELHVLLLAVSDRVAFRKVPRQLVERFPHIQPVPEDPLEREYEAAKRISKALYALYGARP